MPFHFCGELHDIFLIPLYILALVPFVGFYFRSLLSRLDKKLKHKNHTCEHEHDDDSKEP